MEPVTLPFRVWTSRYANPALRADDGLAKAGITLGRPQMPLRYVWTQERMLAPDSAWLHAARPEFEWRMVVKLFDLGIERAEAILRRESALVVPGKEPRWRDVVLLCFEDVRRPGEWCHRQIVAAWLGEHGLVVEELADPSEVDVRLDARGTQGKRKPRLGYRMRPMEAWRQSYAQQMGDRPGDPWVKLARDRQERLFRERVSEREREFAQDGLWE